MNVVLKRIFIAAGLVAVCAAILAAIKSYGVWVITGIAVLLFIFGLLRKEKAPDESGEASNDRGEKSEQDKNP